MNVPFGKNSLRIIILKSSDLFPSLQKRNQPKKEL